MTDDADKLLAEIEERHLVVTKIPVDTPIDPYTVALFGGLAHADRATLLRLLDEATAREARLREAAAEMVERFKRWEDGKPDCWPNNMSAACSKLRAALAPEAKP
jgi:hypothetical protein